MIAPTNRPLKVQANKSGEGCLLLFNSFGISNTVSSNDCRGAAWIFFHLGGTKFQKTGWKQVNVQDVHQYLSFWSCVVQPGTVTL